jgi:lysophospholipase L1-like esterase
MQSFFLIFMVLVISISCSGRQAPQELAGELAAASLKIVRLEQQALSQGTDPREALGEAEGIFLNTVRLDPKDVESCLKNGEGACGQQLDKFLEAARGLPATESRDDPAAVIMQLLAETPETKGKAHGLIAGYAAAFQMCLELERDGTVMQDFLPFLIALGCPMTLRDLGLENAGRPRLEELAATASGRTGKRTYNTEPFDYFITMIKINNWGSKFNGQVTADTLAARMLQTPELKQLLPGLAKLPPARLGFLGDSDMDRIHWATQAPFPEIVAAVLRVANPGMTVINAGKGGDDSGEALARMQKDLLDKNPEISFVMLGGNDCRHWGGPEPAVTPSRYRKNITEITNRLRESGSRVVLLLYPQGPDLSGPDLEVFTAINEEMKAAAVSLKTGCLDIFSLMENRDMDKYYAVDRIHMKPESHMLIAREILDYLANLEIDNL